jgi:hypothetical protein
MADNRGNDPLEHDYEGMISEGMDSFGEGFQMAMSTFDYVLIISF